MIGIMQGRLSKAEPGRFQAFPRTEWRDEFRKAAAAGLQSIEWIFDTYGDKANPIEDDRGIAQMKELAERHQIAIKSVCADYFMERPILRCTPEERKGRQITLAWLLRRCSAAGVQRIVLPFVDQSQIRAAEEIAIVSDFLRATVPAMAETGVEIHLETSLAPDLFAELLERVSEIGVRVNYDSGNSASLGYSPAKEFLAYGRLVGSVHIKDRLLGGGTVPLGTGNADFSTLFRCLKSVNYEGDFVLQTAREESGTDEVELARRNRLLIERWLAAP